MIEVNRRLGCSVLNIITAKRDWQELDPICFQHSGESRANRGRIWHEPGLDGHSTMLETVDSPAKRSLNHTANDAPGSEQSSKVLILNVPQVEVNFVVTKTEHRRCDGSLVHHQRRQISGVRKC